MRRRRAADGPEAGQLIKDEFINIDCSGPEEVEAGRRRAADGPEAGPAGQIIQDEFVDLEFV